MTAAIQTGDTVRFTLPPNAGGLIWGKAWRRRNGREFAALQPSRTDGVWLRDTDTGEEFFAVLRYCEVVLNVPDDLSGVAA